MAWDKKWNENRKKKRAERKVKGLCIQCDEPSSDLVLCDECNEKKVETLRISREKARGRGICQNCFKNKTGGGFHCDECYQKQRVARENLRHGGERTCKTKGCDNAPTYHSPYCMDCTEKYKAEKQSCKVYFYNCAECRILYTTARMTERTKYCSDRCARQSRLTNQINRACTICGVVYEMSRGVNYDTVCSEKCQKEKNRNFQRENKRRRKALLKNAKVTKFSDYEIFMRDEYKCHLCGAKLNPRQKVPHPKAPTIDHVIPISCGGNHTRRNVKCACFMCNAKKGNRTIDGGEQLLLFGT